jgi:hypothetical protein
MRLGETIATYDLGLALRGESGKFEVTSPAGEIYHVICKPNHSISNLEWAGNRTEAQPFMVRKVTETVSLESGVESGKEATATPARTAGAPFLLESQEDDGEPLFATAVTAMLPGTADESGASTGRAGLDLVYLENEVQPGQPEAWVSAKNGSRLTDEISMTVRCATFNELDAEIRRLHAQLDEIRARAKKKFYVAYAAATA